jgi:hypothetical protein
MRQTLDGLRGSADFAGMRDGSEILDLESGERTECAALWRDVDAAIRTIDEMK